MNIIFLGSGQFAVPILQHILDETNWEVSLVVCEAPKPAGRGKKETLSPVHALAKKYNISAFTPQTLKDKDTQKKIAAYEADIFITVAYGKIIPPEVFNTPPHKTVNVHPSLLPKLRGPSPIQRALLEGKQETGVTLMLIDEELDHGPIISQEEAAIAPDDTYNTLEPALAKKGAKMLVRDIPQYVSSDLSPTPQNHKEATYSEIIQKEDGRVDWQESAENIYNRWRAFVRWPGVYTFAQRDGTQLRLVLTELALSDGESEFQPGTIWDQNKKLFIECSTGTVEIIKIQPAGKQPMAAADFMNGYGDILGAQLL